MSRQTEYAWRRHRQGEALLLGLLAEWRRLNPRLDILARRVGAEAGVHLSQLVDHLILDKSPSRVDRLDDAGFVRVNPPGTASPVFEVPGSTLPRVKLVGSAADREIGLALRVESIADWQQAMACPGEIEGRPGAAFRRCHAWREGGVSVWVVERCGGVELDVIEPPDGRAAALCDGLERWLARPRDGADEGLLFDQAQALAGRLSAALGPGAAAHVVFTAERAYWRRRNVAARVQRDRLDRLGLGWGAVDHHTFRGSRRNLTRLVNLFETLGFHCRERFHAGAEAGWGAQVMENPAAGCTLFLDVDLTPQELGRDLAREPLPERDRLGTIGLWCALHGDSILSAGLHHIACHCDFDSTTRGLTESGVPVMEPFSRFPYLQQAFTVAEQWSVRPDRLAALQADGRLSERDAEGIARSGGLGSHLELIQRAEGYKGFNQRTVSDIIGRTDPRRH